jgi:hypothetical protein
MNDFVEQRGCVIRKWATAMVLVCLVCRSRLCAAQTYGDFQYTVSGAGVTITGYTGSGGAVAIPPSIPSVGTVTSIGDGAFSARWGNMSLTSVTIPDSVTSIGGAAFYYCFNLTNVTLGTSVTSIGNETFHNCIRLTDVNLPDSLASIGDSAFDTTDLTSVTLGGSVTNIGQAAFSNCSELTTITVDSLNPAYSSVSGVLFNKSRSTLIQCPGGKSGAYAIPNSVTSIGGSAFTGCGRLTSVAIPDSLTSIGDSAFTWCTGPTSVAIPNSVTNIGDWAFEFCSGLTSVTIPNSVTAIGVDAFLDCSGLTNVIIGTSVTSIGYSAFCGCSSLTSAYFLGDGPISFGGHVFDYANSGFTIYYAASQPPQIETKDGRFGVGTSGFGFNFTDASNTVVVVESCTNLADHIWNPLQTNTLTGGSLYFSDPQWTNYPSCFYRFRRQ